MLEALALPAWNTPGTTVDAWVAQLSTAGGPVVVGRESPTVTWLEVATLRVRGYVVVEDGLAAAINFEFHDPDPSPAARAIEAAAEALGWEVHPDDEADAHDDDEDD